MDGFKKIVKMKTGGLVKTPVTGDKKATAPSKAALKPAFKGSDVAKEKSKPAGHKDPYIKSKDVPPAEGVPSAAIKGRNKKANGTVNKFKCGGKIVKKMADGGSFQGQGAISDMERAALQGALPGGQGQGSASDMERRRMMARAKNAMQSLGPAQQSQFVNQGGMSPTGVSPAPAPTSAPG